MRLGPAVEHDEAAGFEVLQIRPRLSLESCVEDLEALAALREHPRVVLRPRQLLEERRVLRIEQERFPVAKTHFVLGSRRRPSRRTHRVRSKLGSRHLWRGNY